MWLVQERSDIEIERPRYLTLSTISSKDPFDLTREAHCHAVELGPDSQVHKHDLGHVAQG